MAISANKLVYDVARHINSVNSGRANDYRVVDLVSFLNESYEAIIAELILEKDQSETIRNHLRPLMVSNYKLDCSSTSDCNVCKITYPENFYEIINIRAEVCKDCCPGTKKFPVTKPQGDDIDEASRNPYRQANYYFEQLSCYEDTDGLRFYHHNEMEVLNIYIDYYRKIKRIEAPELVECLDNIYLNWDGALIVNNVDFELDTTYISSSIPRVAAAAVNNASGDFAASREMVREILQLNQLHK